MFRTTLAVTALLFATGNLAQARQQPSRTPSKARPPVRLPKTMPIEMVLELLKEVAKTENVFAVQKAEVRRGQPQPVLGYQVPSQVTVSGTHTFRIHGITIPHSAMRVHVEVRCQCTVSYDLARIAVRDGRLLLPEPQVTAAYSDPPGQRGTYRYDCDILRGDWTFWDTAALEALKNRLVLEALDQAAQHYRDEHHAQHEAAFVDRLTQRISERWHQQSAASAGKAPAGKSSK
jgi:hypothetical protein